MLHALHALYTLPLSCSLTSVSHSAHLFASEVTQMPLGFAAHARLYVQHRAVRLGLRSPPPSKPSSCHQPLPPPHLFRFDMTLSLLANESAVTAMSACVVSSSRTLPYLRKYASLRFCVQVSSPGFRVDAGRVGAVEAALPSAAALPSVAALCCAAALLFSLTKNLTVRGQRGKRSVRREELSASPREREQQRAEICRAMARRSAR